MGYSAGMDRVSCSALPTSEGAGGPFIPGPDASMVDAGHLPCESMPTSSNGCPVSTGGKTLPIAMPLHVSDTPVGLHAVMQCLPWPFWCDPQRSYLSPGLYRQLWTRSENSPQLPIKLDRMMQWAPITRKWQHLHASPSPDVLLRDLLRSHKSDACSGEWGTHPHVLQKVGARALIPDTCMCIQVAVQKQHATLQACVDA